jgi:hypothetical protein
MKIPTISAERFGRRGNKIEAATITIEVIGNEVYIYIRGDKKTQHWYMTKSAWETLISQSKDNNGAD